MENQSDPKVPEYSRFEGFKPDSPSEPWRDLLGWGIAALFTFACGFGAVWIAERMVN